MLNKVFIIGRVGKDPELHTFDSNSSMCTLSVATKESYKDKDGNFIDKTEWHRVVVFNRQAENCVQWLHKGSLILVEGALQTRKWTDNKGEGRYTTEIKAHKVRFLEKRQGEETKQEPESDYGIPKSTKQMDSRPGNNYGLPESKTKRDAGNYPRASGGGNSPASIFKPSESQYDDLPF